MALPKYPVFVPTKGRWDTRWTIRGFQHLGLPFTAVVEPQEYDEYAKHVPEEQLLVTPHRDKGLTVTRNFIWDHAASLGVKRFWTFDDNIGVGLRKGVPGVFPIFRLFKNHKSPCNTPTPLRVIEELVERYENVPIAGMNYYMFASRKSVVPPVYLNTRVYSNMLIETDARDPMGRVYRNETFFNDDTDLCLRVLKDGWCTILVNAFLIFKRTTMTIKGGMTGHYQGDGRYKMALELKRAHPDVTKITRKWGRWQHQVDYKPFKRNKLRLRPGVEIPDGADEFGMLFEYDDESARD